MEEGDKKKKMMAEIKEREAKEKREKELVMDAVYTGNKENDADPLVVATQSPGIIFWSVYGEISEYVGLPWIPFFSNCDTFDSHIVITL